MIGPPYESSFVRLFLPLLQNESIAGTISLRTEEERKCIKEFIGNSRESNHICFARPRISTDFRSRVDLGIVEYLVHVVAAHACVLLVFLTRRRTV